MVVDEFEDGQPDIESSCVVSRKWLSFGIPLIPPSSPLKLSLHDLFDLRVTLQMSSYVTPARSSYIIVSWWLLTRLKL